MRQALPALLLIAGTLGAAETAAARNVILFIGDGMNINHEVAASRYLHGADRELSFHRLPYCTSVTTWDVTSYNIAAKAAGRKPYAESAFIAAVGYDPARGGAEPPVSDEPVARAYYLPDGRPAATDSASSATAIATGRKTDDGNISWKARDPPDGAYRTIAELARASGRRIGVVSTVPFNHATPAAFVSHNIHRGNYRGVTDAAIDHEIICTVKPDVVIAGGHPGWCDEYLNPANYAVLRAGEYRFVERVAGQDGGAALMAAAADAKGRKLFGLFGGAGGFFGFATVADQPGSPSITAASVENPSLAQCATAALRTLTADGTSTAGSFVMIEAGDIDWANHANNFPAMIGAVHALDQAVQAAIAFVDRPGDQVDWGNTLLIVTADHSNSFMRLPVPLGKGDLPPLDAKGRATDGSVTYGTGHHTNEPVWLYAQGAGVDLFKPFEGSWYPGTRLIDNTHIFHVMLRALGLQAPPGQEVPLAPVQP